MNNDQFRKLVQNTPRQAPSTDSSASQSNQTHRNGATSSSALGSRMRSSIPMTPRSIGGYSSKNDFARQLAERNAEQQPQKKFRSMAAPKGSKLGAGYVDRARAREEGEESDKVQRVKALEDMMKLQQIDEPTFIQLREEILGKDVGERAALVKGLDWTLLERVKKGEVGVADILDPSQRKQSSEEEVDVDEEFDELEDMKVEAVAKAQVKKKGEMAPAELTGRKRTRDQVLAEMKAARLAAKEAAQPSLGAKFKKVGDKRAESRIERDAKGREVLITVDEHGNEKRKVRRVDTTAEAVPKDLGLLMPDKDVKPLGMEVPDVPKVEEVEEDDDIFADVGDDYDPLAGLSDEDSNEEGEDNEKKHEGTPEKPVEDSASEAPTSMPPPPKPRPTNALRNYFDAPASATDESASKPMALSDPTLLAAIKKASAINAIPKVSESSEEAEKEARRRKMLENHDRDAQDMDMGFGSSRFEDEEDFDDKRVKLSEWGQDVDDEGGGDGKSEKAKRKRGGKKRKGDKNSAADVLGVMKRQKEERNS